MDRWLKLDPTKYVHGRNAKTRGACYREVSSPYDIPEAIHCQVDDKGRMFVVHFQYLVDEQPLLKQIQANDGFVRLFVGAHSGRLLKIESDLGNAGPDHLAELMKSVEHISTAIQAEQAKGKSFDVAAQALADGFAELIK